jgi:hypothetical protein
MKIVVIRFLQFLLLVVLHAIFFVAGSMAVSGHIPDIPSEPGLVSGEIGLLLISTVNTLIVMALILSSRWSGWKLILGLSFAYYGLVTFLTQIETWYFLTDITVEGELLTRLFLMGIPVAFLFIPIAVWILGKGRTKPDPESNSALVMPVSQWVWKLAIIAVIYVALYWLAGYFIAWQNPELRAFYGSPGEIAPFFEHTAVSISEEPGLFLFQILRSMLWVLCALPVIRGSKLKPWQTAILLGVFFSIPMNIGHILENPLMPLASVRFSHMIETALSTFIFGLIVAWLLHREHHSVKGLFGLNSTLSKS